MSNSSNRLAISSAYSAVNYLPATLKTNKSGWLIEYYVENPQTQELSVNVSNCKGFSLATPPRRIEFGALINGKSIFSNSLLHKSIISVVEYLRFLSLKQRSITLIRTSAFFDFGIYRYLFEDLRRRYKILQHGDLPGLGFISTNSLSIYCKSYDYIVLQECLSMH